MPRIVTAAVSNRLNPSIGRTRCFIRRWSCSMTLFKYLQERIRTRRGKVPAAFNLATARCEAAYPSKVIGRNRFRFIEAQGRRDEAAIGERCPDGRQEVGSEPRLNDIAEPARIECGLGEVGVFVDREEDQARRLVRAPELARRFDAVEPRHGDVEHDDIRMESLRLSKEFASIAHS